MCNCLEEMREEIAHVKESQRKVLTEMSSLRQDTNITFSSYSKRLGDIEGSIEGLVDIMHSVAGFLKTLGWIGVAIKWLAVFSAACVATWKAIEALLQFFKVG